MIVFRESEENDNLLPEVAEMFVGWLVIIVFFFFKSQSNWVYK